MTLVLTFFLNAALNFATGLAVAAVLGPQEFGQFAVASMIAIVLSTSLFDWLRLSATRHYSEHARITHPDLRSSLDSVYLVGGLLLAACVLIVTTFGLTPWLSAMLVVAVAATSFATGQFEYWSALARARFLDKTYIQLVVCKNVLALALMVIAGRVFHSTISVLAALTLSIVIAIASVWPRLRDSNARLALAKSDRIFGFAKYGVPIVVANVFYQIIILANRWALAAQLGYGDAGQLSLPTDVTIRIFLSLGAGFDVFLFQNAMRLEATQGVPAAKRQIAKNMVFVVAALLPAAAGYAVVLPFFEALFVPSAYRGLFSQVSLVLIPGVLSFCLAQFAFGPVLQLAHRTGPLVFAAVAGAACDVVLLVSLPPGSGPVAFAIVHSVSLLVSSVAVGFYAFRLRDCIPSLRDLAAIVIATGLMVASIWPLRTIGLPWLALSSSIVIGGIVYAASVLVFNVADLRNSLTLQLRALGMFAK
ncbi:lipopolysaccharide biosynthesis protein [Methyloferula stellata]|uniref:lipopolysaccharide biosynthesis protein n=1 Tax=Methyloferula stellata TaxID=876270 RepID=UPI0003765B93|nr:polysaccharide biosynthesis C-terminal domain-containing protein [Methyloferula stellata]